MSLDIDIEMESKVRRGVILKIFITLLKHSGSHRYT